jgi:hypothetical protein
MYTIPHWIAVIRLFTHRAIPMEEARRLVKPVAEEFGKESVAEACEVLVEIVPGKEPVARLKSHIRRMAFQIIGPEPTTPAPETAKPKKTTPSTPDPARESSGEGKPVKQPRHYVLKKCEAWLKEAGHAFVAVDDVKKTTPAVAPHVGSLDFIVLRGDEKLFVTVRPHLQKKHLAAMSALQKLFGPEYRPVRIWPAEAPDGWTWPEVAIDVSAP